MKYVAICLLSFLGTLELVFRILIVTLMCLLIFPAIVYVDSGNNLGALTKPMLLGVVNDLLHV